MKKYRLVLHRCIIERAKGAFIQKYKPWCYFSPLLILSVMDARVPLCKRTMGNKKLRAEIKLWNHMILKEYLPNTKQKKKKSTFSNISYKRKNIFLKYVTFVYSILSGTLNCRADKPVTLFYLEISAIVTGSRIMQNITI